MKKFYFIFASALVIASCSQAEIAGPDDGASSFGGTKVTFFATHETDEDPAVRTVLSGSSVNWAYGDQIKIIGTGGGESATSEALTLADPAANADFEVDVEGITPAFAVYPAGVTATTDGSAISLTVPAAQTGGSFGSAAIEVSEIGPGNALSFKSLTAVLKVSISAEDIAAGVNKVSITAYGGKTIAGVAEVSFTDGLPVIEPDVTSPSSTVTLSGISAAGDYYLSILPVADLEDGFYIELKHDDTVIGQKLTGKTLTLSRRDVIGLGSIDRSLITGTFVTVSGNGTKDGSSWDNALDWAGFRSAIGTSGTLSGNFFIAGGKYTLTTPTTGINLRGSTSFAFYGGYDPKSTGTELSKRNTSVDSTIFDGNNACRLFVWNLDGIETLFDGVTFQNATYASAAVGSALVIQTYSSAVFNNCTIKNNTNTSSSTSAGGGAVRVAGGPCTFTNCTFSGNSAVYAGGAVVVNAGSKVVTMTNCTFNNNMAGTSDGTTFSREGGALWLKGGTLVLDNCTFEKNQALRGAAIYASSAAYTLKANKCYFVNNNDSNKSSTTTGGAVWGNLSTGIMYFNACSFYLNYTGQYASAIGSKGLTGVYNCSFQQNTNSSGIGAANYFSNSGKSIIANSTFRTTGITPVAVWAGGGEINLVNSILVNSSTKASPTDAELVALKSGYNASDWPGSMLNSYGHNVYSKKYQQPDVSGGSTFSGPPDGHADGADYKLNQSYSVANRCATWSKWRDGWTSTDGAPAGFSLTTNSYVESVLTAFDTANSTDFKTWLTGLGALGKDIRGVARGASIWPGCYDNGAVAALN